MVFNVPYVPSPIPVVRSMLRLSSAGPSDIVYDLGCGDARILIIAVKEFNVWRAIGVEKDYRRYLAALKNIAIHGIGGRALVIHGDMFYTDISDASIVTLFLLTSVNEMLKPKLEKELKPGTRVVSHEFKIPGWRVAAEERVIDNRGFSHRIYLYIIGRHK